MASYEKQKCQMCGQDSDAMQQLAERTEQVKLAQQGYDYMGACADADHYKKELSAANAQIAELTWDVKRHVAMATSLANDNIELRVKLEAAELLLSQCRNAMLLANGQTDWHLMIEAIDAAIKESKP